MVNSGRGLGKKGNLEHKRREKAEQRFEKGSIIGHREGKLMGLLIQDRIYNLDSEQEESSEY